MKTVESYKVAWNINANEGTLILDTSDGVEHMTMDSPQECLLLLDILRNEKPLYIDQGVLFTGFEEVGEGEVAGEQAAS